MTGPQPAEGGDGLYFGPCLNPGGGPDWLTGHFAARADMRLPLFGEPALTDEQLDHLRAEWERKRHGPVKLLTPLPRRVRVRLAAESAINHAGTWLVYHGHYRAAERLWRLFGMWK